MEPGGVLTHSQDATPVPLNPVEASHSRFLIYFNIIFPSMPMSSRCSPPSLKFHHENPVCTSPASIRVTCHVDLILLDCISRMTFGEQYVSWSSSLCSPRLRVFYRYMRSKEGLYLILLLNSLPIPEWILGSTESVTQAKFVFEFRVITPNFNPFF